MPRVLVLADLYQRQFIAPKALEGVLSFLVIFVLQVWIALHQFKGDFARDLNGVHIRNDIRQTQIGRSALKIGRSALARAGLYARLWRLQSESGEENDI